MVDTIDFHVHPGLVVVPRLDVEGDGEATVIAGEVKGRGHDEAAFSAFADSDFAGAGVHPVASPTRSLRVLVQGVGDGDRVAVGDAREILVEDDGLCVQSAKGEQNRKNK